MEDGVREQVMQSMIRGGGTIESRKELRGLVSLVDEDRDEG